MPEIFYIQFSESCSFQRMFLLQHKKIVYKSKFNKKYNVLKEYDK